MADSKEDQWYMKKPCKHCPYCYDTRVFLMEERGIELAYHATNPYNSFPCHKTLNVDDDGETLSAEDSKTCAGFLALQIGENGDRYKPDEFEIPPNAFTCADDMIYKFEEHYYNEEE